MPTMVTSKGQVTIPKPIRDRLGIKAGSAVDFRMEDDGKIVLFKVAEPAAKAAIDKWRGAADTGLSTDEIMAMTRGEP